MEPLESRVVFNATFDSAISIGSSGYDAAFDVATDPSGNQYMAGYFQGTVDFDPAAAHYGDTDIRSTAGDERDIFLAKYAPDGSFLWVRQMVGAPGSSATKSTARSVTTDANGNAYLAGDFMGTVSFGVYSLTSTNGTKDGFVAKVASDGTVLWADQWGGAEQEYVEGVAIDSAGNVLTAGYTFKVNPDGSNAYVNMQIGKFAPTGTPLWQKKIGNTNGGNEAAFGIGADTAGNVYVSGSFKGTVDFDPGSNIKNVQGGPNDNGFVLKLTANGDFGWASPFVAQTSGASSGCRDLVVDGNGNVVVGGYYRGPVDFKPGSGTYKLPYYSDTTGGGFVEKLNSSGAMLWVQPVGAVGYSAVNDLALDSAGNVYTVGTFQGQLDFDPGSGTTNLTSNGGTDVFVAKFNTTGAFQWAVSFGGTGNDYASGIAVDSSGNVYVAGYYFDTVDFDPNPLSTKLKTSAGFNDAFLLKLKQT